ncbi:MAG: hypothetical protein M1830_002898, partial [Pleopsidium flavum]
FVLRGANGQLQRPILAIWQLRPCPDGSYNLCTRFLGVQMQLDIYGDEKAKPHLGPAGDISGQRWTIELWGVDDNRTFKVTN